MTKKLTLKDISEESYQIIDEIYENSVRSVVRQNRESWIQHIIQRLSGAVNFSEIQHSNGIPSEDDTGWILISSLSQVRKEVGGRFQNIRDRWVGAGFPLKEHRGSGKEPYKIDDDGWLEVTTWLLKQGYESRLASDDSEGYFEIRKRD